uniref:Uncharacterized protein n=1 Tax=Rhipicephalus microplus TaxID=6941 RepID=A0A6G5AE43_RHIMP
MREHGWFCARRSPHRFVGISSAVLCPGYHNHPVDSLDYQAQESTEQQPEAPPEGALMPAQGSEKKLYRLLWDPLFMVNMVTLMLSWVIMGLMNPPWNHIETASAARDLEYCTWYSLQVTPWERHSQDCFVTSRWQHFCFYRSTDDGFRLPDTWPSTVCSTRPAALDGLRLPDIHGCWYGCSVHLQLLVGAQPYS